MRVAVVLVMLCGFAASAHAESDDVLVQVLVNAVAKQDTAALAALARDEVVLEGLWFASPVCMKQFSGFVALTSAGHAALLKCFATLDLSVAPGVGGRLTALTYEPGGRIFVKFRDNKLASIAGNTRMSETAASISDEILRSHLVSGARVVEPDPAVRAVLDSSSTEAAFARLLVCVGPTGQPDRVADLAIEL